MATVHPCLLWRERGESPISTADTYSRRDRTVARSTPGRGEGGACSGRKSGPLDGPTYGTVRPAAGRPAIVTGCAGVSCPVTLVAGVSIAVAPPEQLRLRRRDRYHYTSTVTQFGQGGQGTELRLKRCRAPQNTAGFSDVLLTTEDHRARMGLPEPILAVRAMVRVLSVRPWFPRGESASAGRA
jgi:hypothetical protein